MGILHQFGRDVNLEALCQRRDIAHGNDKDAAKTTIGLRLPKNRAATGDAHVGVPAEAEEGAGVWEIMQDLYRHKALENLPQDIAMLWRNIPMPVVALLHGMAMLQGLY